MTPPNDQKPKRGRPPKSGYALESEINWQKNIDAERKAEEIRQAETNDSFQAYYDLLNSVAPATQILLKNASFAPREKDPYTGEIMAPPPLTPEIKAAAMAEQLWIRATFLEDVLKIGDRIRHDAANAVIESYVRSGLAANQGKANGLFAQLDESRHNFLRERSRATMAR